MSIIVIRIYSVRKLSDESLDHTFDVNDALYRFQVNTSKVLSIV